MDQVIHILETEKVQTIVKIDRDTDLITDALKKSKILEERVRELSVSNLSFHLKNWLLNRIEAKYALFWGYDKMSV